MFQRNEYNDCAAHYHIRRTGLTVQEQQHHRSAVPDVESFNGAGDLATPGANWTASRLIEIWNSIPKSRRGQSDPQRSVVREQKCSDQ
jgi:hypothetical protein